jgi:hypothetical protein
LKKISIIYRACNRELNTGEFNISRPYWFCKKKCWRNFFNEFGNRSDVEILVVFDGNENDELASYIRKYTNNILYLNNVGNLNSLLFCYDTAKTVDSEFIMFSEDDYLWLDKSCDILIEGLDKFKTHGSVSLYHHPDRIFRNDDITLGHEYITITNSCYWRTAESNTFTFGISKDIFLRYYQEFINCGISDRLLFINLLKKYNFRHFVPISERVGATHVNRFFSTLFIDWERYNHSINV